MLEKCNFRAVLGDLRVLPLAGAELSLSSCGLAVAVRVLSNEHSECSWTSRTAAGRQGRAESLSCADLKNASYVLYILCTAQRRTEERRNLG